MAIWESIAKAVFALVKECARYTGTAVGVRVTPTILRGLAASAPNLLRWVELLQPPVHIKLMTLSARITRLQQPLEADRSDIPPRKQSCKLIRVVTAGQALQAEQVTKVCKSIFNKYDICDLEHLIRPIYFVTIAVVAEADWESLDLRFREAYQAYQLNRSAYGSRASKALVRIGADFLGFEDQLDELDAAAQELERRMAADEQYLETG